MSVCRSVRPKSPCFIFCFFLTFSNVLNITRLIKVEIKKYFLEFILNFEGFSKFVWHATYGDWPSFFFEKYELILTCTLHTYRNDFLMNFFSESFTKCLIQSPYSGVQRRCVRSSWFQMFGNILFREETSKKISL